MLGAGDERRAGSSAGARRGSRPSRGTARARRRGPGRARRCRRISSSVSPASAFESSPQVVLPEPEQPVQRGQADGLAELEQPLAVEVDHLVEELAEVVPVLVRELDARRPRPRRGRSASGPTGSRLPGGGGPGSRGRRRRPPRPARGRAPPRAAAITPPKLWPTSRAFGAPIASISAKQVGRVVGRGVAVGRDVAVAVAAEVVGGHAVGRRPARSSPCRGTRSRGRPSRRGSGRRRAPRPPAGRGTFRPLTSSFGMGEVLAVSR